MPLGGSTTLGWVVTVGFLVGFVLPVMYITYIAMQDAAHAETPASESAAATESES